MKPVIFYVDDEPHNLTVFEAALPSDWEIKIFDNPVKALDQLDTHKPWVIVSDQRMPGMTGVQFLELSRKIRPEAIRIIVTGYSDENLVVDSVRRAQIYDYIRKPWDHDELETSLNRAIALYKSNSESKELLVQLQSQKDQLVLQTQKLEKLATELELAHHREKEMRAELECWVPPFVIQTIKENKITFPITKDLVGITFDIVNSADLHGKEVNGRSIRSLIIQTFSEAIIRHGGWRESHSGDSAYGHFGLFESKINPFDAAFAVAREFRVSLRGICDVNNVSFECGIALHLSKNSNVDVHTVHLNTPQGSITQKSFDTTSKDIDLLHKMEKLVHQLPGTNIIMSKDFVNGLSQKPTQLKSLGTLYFSNISSELFVFPSDLVKDTHLENLKSQFGQVRNLKATTAA